MKLQDIITTVQMETNSVGDSRIKPADWTRWVADSITEAYSEDSCLRIQSGFTILDAVFPVDTGTDPDSVSIPDTLLPFHRNLEAYVEYRYHASSPTNPEEKAAAEACYARFLNGLRVTTRG